MATLRRRAVIGLAAVWLAMAAPGAASAQGADLKVVARLDLGGKGRHAGVAAWDATAVVVTDGAAGTCGPATVTVVDVRRGGGPRRRRR